MEHHPKVRIVTFTTLIIIFVVTTMNILIFFWLSMSRLAIELYKQIRSIFFLLFCISSSFYSAAQSCDCPSISTCGPCSGGLTSLTLQFNGAGASNITVSDQMGVVFSGVVNAGARFTFQGSISNQKFVGTNIEVRINGSLDATIGSDCAAGVFVGNVYSNFTVKAGLSKTGGAICCAPASLEKIAPVITNCPVNIVVGLPVSACSVGVNWVAPSATDNCAVESFTSNHVPGEVFSLGITSITYTARDPYGNSAGCSFTVTVKDDTKPVITSCPINISVSANASCQSAVTWTAPTASDNCSATMTSNHSPGEVFPIGTTLITYTATDPSGNATTCSFNVIVEDTTSPVITGCPSDISIVPNASCQAIVNWAPPTATDNCSVQLVSNYNPGNTFPIGVTSVTYTATDQKGNATSCTFNIIVSSESNPVIEGCPERIAASADENGEASVSWDEPTATVLCGSVSLTKSHEPGSIFSVGVTPVLYEFKDDSGNSSRCTFNVIVSEQEVDVVVSNVVTPDGEGNNDTWVITNIEKFKNNTVVIVDRWGNKIYHASGYDNENIFWNGTNKNGTKVPTGTYFYTLEIKLRTQVVNRKGFIEVIQ